MLMTLPVSKQKCSGWVDYDEKHLKGPLCRLDRAFYLEQRLEMIFFRPMDRVYLRSAPYHRAVNSKKMSFAMIGTSMIASCINMLGMFLLGSRSYSQERDINKKRFISFIADYLPQWNKLARFGTFVPKWLWDNLRNPLNHEFLIREGGLENLGWRRFREKTRGKIEIHSEILYKDLRKATKQYFSDIRTGKDPALANSFEVRFVLCFPKF